MKKQIKGFTLLEIMVALMIFAIIAFIISTSFFAVLSARNETRKVAERMAKLQIAVTLLQRDLSQIVERPIINTEGIVEDAIAGDENTVNFTHSGLTNPLAATQRSTLQRVSYYVQNNILIRQSWPHLDRAADDNALVKQLIDHVHSIQFNYLNAKNEFVNAWPEAGQTRFSLQTSRLPRAVNFQIILDDEKIISLTIATTNQIKIEVQETNTQSKNPNNEKDENNVDSEF